MKLDVTSSKYEVVGIVASSGNWNKQGPLGCLGAKPDVYTRVSGFVPWIKESMTKASNPNSFMQLYQVSQSDKTTIIEKSSNPDLKA